jgi:hypothetical protein
MEASRKKGIQIGYTQAQQFCAGLLMRSTTAEIESFSDMHGYVRALCAADPDGVYTLSFADVNFDEHGNEIPHDDKALNAAGLDYTFVDDKPVSVFARVCICICT